MMDWTDRHCRFFLRLLSKHALLYTEMVTTGAILHGDHDRFLLEYIVSFRQHSDFHEQCVERIFLDLQRLLKPEKLTVYARYVRRGGLDINPYRSTENTQFLNVRLARQ